MTEKPNYLGHRSRVRKKFITSRGNGFFDYELLEMLLFSAYPRRDTKDIAKRLIAKFGNLSAVINADFDVLQSFTGLSETALMQIKIVSEINKRSLKKSARAKPVLSNWPALLDYASALLKNLNYEVFRVLFLDQKHQLIEDEFFGLGEGNHVFISAKEVVKKALLLSASSVILLHNHPSGELRASVSDIKTTNEIAAALQKLEIKILDHLIITPHGHYSFKEKGLL